MGIMVYSLLWLVQDLYHQPLCHLSSARQDLLAGLLVGQKSFPDRRARIDELVKAFRV